MNTLENTIQFTDKHQTFLTIYQGTYDTPKKLNRSTSVISDAIISEIENGTITSEMISNLSKEVPVFKYKTCLTIHGDFGSELKRSRIGGYKNLVQNKNGSIEVHWNAIDYQKKSDIGQIISTKAWRWVRNSKADMFVKQTRTHDKEDAIQQIKHLREYWANKTLQNCKAKVFIEGYSYFGMYYIIVNVVPFIIEDPKSFAFQVADITPEEYAIAQIEKEKHEAESMARIEVAARKREQLAEIIAEERERLSMKYTKCNGSFNEGQTYFKPLITLDGTMKYRFMTIKKASFGRIVCTEHTSSEVAPNKDAKTTESKAVKPIEVKNYFQYN